MNHFCIATMTPGAMVVKYRSHYAIERDDRDLHRSLRRDMEKCCRIDSLRKAVASNDRDALAKAADSTELAQARADLLKTRSGALVDPSLERIAAIMRDYTARAAALEIEKKKSERYLHAWESVPPWCRTTTH